ncbi:MAG TPA: hypothetical protein VMW66_05065, partial [Elusimicrobiales bacterium]|nr:hypothetical protein [Elusimicrobiales bacterium]
TYAKIVSCGKGKRISPLNDLICHEGNIKVPSTTAIFNFCAATDCPSRKLGLCAASKANVKCYALKSERGYRPYALPYRRRQELYWKSVSAEQFASEFLFINSLKKKPFLALRFGESGDFHTQICVDKAEEIARLLRLHGIITYCYTSRKDLSYKSIKNLIIYGSDFSKKGISGIFKIIKNKKDKPSGYGMCKANCRECNRCMTRGKLTCVMSH